MSLEIRTTWSKIGIQTTRPSLEIRQARGEMEIKPQKTEVVIDRELPRVLLDQSACFKESGLKNMGDLAAEAAEIARESALEYTGVLAEEGDRLAQIENPEDAFADVAFSRMEREDNREWTIALMPQSRPQIEVTGHLKIDWQVIEGGMEYQRRYPEFKFRRWTTKIYLQQQGKVEIRYLDQKV